MFALSLGNKYYTTELDKMQSLLLWEAYGVITGYGNTDTDQTPVVMESPYIQVVALGYAM